MALDLVPSSGPGSMATPIALGVSGLGLIVAGAFPTVPHSVFHRVRLPACRPAGGPARAGRRSWATYSIVSGVAVLVFFGFSGRGPSGALLVPSAAGLLQRIAIIAGLGWVLAIVRLQRSCHAFRAG